MVKISAVIITLNEEKNIERCLASLKGVVDEIVVLDSFSSDRTEEICRQYGVKFAQQKFRSFIRQKNDAVALASYDCIFSIDADEVVSPELKAAILAVKQKENPCDAYSLNRLTNYCGKWIYHCGWYPDRLIRLFNRQKGSFQGNYIHEKVVLQEPATLADLEGHLWHYSYNSVSEHIFRANKYTDMTALEAFEKGKKAPLFKIWLNPQWKFIRDYFFKKGFLDGYSGYVVCRISAFATYLKYTKLRALHKKQGGHA